MAVHRKNVIPNAHPDLRCRPMGKHLHHPHRILKYLKRHPNPVKLPFEASPPILRFRARQVVGMRIQLLKYSLDALLLICQCLGRHLHRGILRRLLTNDYTVETIHVNSIYVVVPNQV